jgi:hypothetical protein
MIPKSNAINLENSSNLVSKILLTSFNSHEMSLDEKSSRSDQNA